MFPTILFLKDTNKGQKFFQNSAKVKMTHFIISIAAKHRRENNKQRK